MKTTYSLFILCLLCLVLPFTSGCGSSGVIAAKENTERVAYKADAFTLRILASRIYPEDAKIIEQGEKTTDTDIMDSTGKVLLARWVPVVESERDNFDNESIVRREREKMLEVLVKYNDGVDITGEYLTSVERTTRQHESLAIAFEFNPIGANKCARLTSANLPDPVDHKLKRHMGVIINDRLYCAPTIMARIQGSGIIEFSRKNSEEARKKLSQDIDVMIEKMRRVEE
jgi:preprotein translocase subunit SecD